MSSKAKVIPLIDEINLHDYIVVDGNNGLITDIHYGKFGPRIGILFSNEKRWYFLSELNYQNIQHYNVMYDATAHDMHTLGYRD